MFSLLYVNKQHQSGVVPLQMMPSSARDQATMFGGFKGDNTNLEKDAPSIEESLAIGRMPTSRVMRFPFILTYFFLYVNFLLDESYTLGRFFIPTGGNGFQKKVKSLICIIHLLYFVGSIRIGTMFDISSNLCLLLLFFIFFIFFFMLP